ncbi:hypothetical protein JCM8202_004147 [Rhodotorula sphaerocarpa]
MTAERSGFNLLPLELVEHIVRLALDGLSRFADQATLVALSRVNKLSAAAAQPLLYRNIVLDSARSAHALLVTLRETPRLATLVLALTIDHAVFVFSDGQDTATARFTSVDQEFLISLCPNSSISTRPSRPGRPATTHQTFLLPHLQALILDNSSVPEEVFRWLVTGSTALRVLHVWLVAGMTDDSMEQIISSNSDGLREFMFKPVHDFRHRRNFIPHNHGQLHGLRLTRLRFHPGEIARFLSRVGGNLSTLAFQQIPELLGDLLLLCPRLEQLDVEQHWELDGLASVLPTSPMTALTFLRVEVEVKDANLSLIRDRLALLPRLSMLDLYVRGSASLRADYDLSVLRAAFDDLLQACEERHICLFVNARPVATFGGFRTAAATRYNTRDAVEFHI